jgi:hypothetical protein
MHILLERTGGFAGLKRQGSLDSSTLPLPQERRLKELLKRSRFFELPSVLEREPQGVDLFIYRVTVETEKGTHTVAASEAAVPAEMRPLLDFLTRSLFRK